MPTNDEINRQREADAERARRDKVNIATVIPNSGYDSRDIRHHQYKVDYDAA